MRDEGEIVAVDKYDIRLQLLENNIQRLGFKSIKSVAANALDYEDNLFDRVLADVPCSGTGTISKKPDIKWKKDLLDLNRMAEPQLKYIKKAASLVKPGGCFVYSTCSIEPEENSEIVKIFLENNSSFRLVSAKGSFPDELLDELGCIQTFPHIHKMDGAFAAKFERIE
jgi:16S rRNA (cytosine967-C5)-methyltransferase